MNGVPLPIELNPVVLRAPLDVSQKLPTDIIPRDQMEVVARLDDTQIALHLLRYIRNSKFTYDFRLSSAEASCDFAGEMMSVTRRALATMLKCNSLPDAAWQQALLPRGPGLGLTNLVLMAPVMARASILEAVARLAQADPGCFGRFASLSTWEKFKDAPIHPVYRSAIEIGLSATDLTMALAVSGVSGLFKKSETALGFTTQAAILC